MFFLRIVSGMPYARVRKVSSKNNKNWYVRLVDFNVPDKIQPAMLWRVVIQMASCTITLVCFAW